MIKTTHDEIKCAKDLPADHIFGLKVDVDNDFKGIIQHNFDVKEQQERFEQVEQEFKPSQQKFNLKPPRPTKANNLRTKFQLEKKEGEQTK